MNNIKIAWMFPDTLYLHGDRGNILALDRLAKMAGLEPEIIKIDFDTENFNPMDYDILVFNPGEITSFPVIIEWLVPHKDSLIEFINEGRVVLATGTSVGIFTENIIRSDKTEFKGLSIINADTKERETVYGDDNYFVCNINGKDIEVIGNQIQMADFINKGEQAFGRLKYGFGNTGKDREEGFVKQNAIFTNTLGPFLVTNPKVTKELILIMCENRGYEIKDFPVDMEIEEKSFATKKIFIETKVTRLTNCKEVK